MSMKRRTRSSSVKGGEDNPELNRLLGEGGVKRRRQRVEEEQQELLYKNKLKELQQLKRERARKNWRGASKLLSYVVRGTCVPWSLQWPKAMNDDCVILMEPLSNVESFVFRHVSGGGVCHGYDGLALSDYLLTDGCKFVSPYTKVPFSAFDLKRLDVEVSMWCRLNRDAASDSDSTRPSVFARRYRPAWRQYEHRLATHAQELASLAVQFEERVTELFSNNLEDRSVLELLHNLSTASLFFLDCAEFDGQAALKWLLELRRRITADDDGEEHDLALMILAWTESLQVDWAEQRGDTSPWGDPPAKPPVVYLCGVVASRTLSHKQLGWVRATRGDHL